MDQPHISHFLFQLSQWVPWSSTPCLVSCPWKTLRNHSSFPRSPLAPIPVPCPRPNASPHHQVLNTHCHLVQGLYLVPLVPTQPRASTPPGSYDTRLSVPVPIHKAPRPDLPFTQRVMLTSCLHLFPYIYFSNGLGLCFEIRVLISSLLVCYSKKVYLWCLEVSFVF